MKIANQIRQGDVLVTPVAAIPADAERVKPASRIVLAYGEATNHHHAIDYAPKQMEVLSRDGEIYLRVKSPVVLTHQEHAPATISPGEYVVKKQVETWLDEVRAVRD